MTNTNPLEMDYTNRDYQSIRTFLVSAAQGFMPEWVTAGEPADFGTLLLELYAYVGDTVNYYIDRVAAEPFLATAVRRQSILGIADMLGYTPIAQQAATGQVTLSLADSAYLNDTVTIPSGTLVQTQTAEGQAAIYFETMTTITLGQTTRSAYVGVTEGRTNNDEFLALSNGAPMQEYVLMFQGVIQRTVRMEVQETDTTTVAWSYVDNLVDSDPDAAVFTTYIDDQFFTHVVFGDNVAGRIPPNGASISVSYRYGQGALGNVAAGTIVLLSSPVAGVSVTNEGPLSGGADNESIDNMRFSIPRATKLRDRAITLQDFGDLCLQVPGVAKAYATGQYYTQIKIYIAPVGGGYPTNDLRSQVEQYLLDRTLVGVSVEVHPMFFPPDPRAEWLYEQIALSIDLYVQPQYGQLTVTNAVKDALTSLFSFPNMDFGLHMSQGDIFHTCLQIPGVDYIILTQFQFFDNASPPVLVPPVVGDLQAAPNLVPALDPGKNLHITPHGGLT